MKEHQMHKYPILLLQPLRKQVVKEVIQLIHLGSIPNIFKLLHLFVVLVLHKYQDTYVKNYKGKMLKMVPH